MRELPQRICCAVIAVAVCIAVLFERGNVCAARDDDRPPNFIVILCDNLGYGDIGCFGSVKHRTPHIDRMAREGTKFTSFYVTSGVCTPSRASIMTGCYPSRVGLHVTDLDGHVLRPVSHNGLNPDEITIAEVLKQRDYATALIGKWHLGDQPQFLPTRQGFDYYYGIPYSDDMTPREGKPWPPLPLMRNEEVIEAPADRDTLTKRYTHESIEFITANREQPFFLLLAHAMPGSTREPFASDDFRGKSANGAWGDSVEEIDWSTGEILAALKRLKLDDNTLVIWTSDNGAPRRQPPQGSNLPLGGWGYTTMEGGMRVPCIMRWPGKTPADKECDEIATTMDLLPTFAKLADTTAPRDRIIDGHNIWPLISGRDGATSPHEAFLYYHLDTLHAVRSGRWKLHLALPEGAPTFGGRPDRSKIQLFDLQADLAETSNVADKHPDVVQRLLNYAEQAREDLGDFNRKGKNQRPVGHESDPQPVVLHK